MVTDLIYSLISWMRFVESGITETLTDVLTSLAVSSKLLSDQPPVIVLLKWESLVQELTG